MLYQLIIVLVIILLLLYPKIRNYKQKKAFFRSFPEHPSRFFMVCLSVLQQDPKKLLVSDLFKDKKIPPYTHCGPSLSGLNLILVNDVKSIKQVLIDHNDFGRLPEFYDAVSLLLGLGLVTSEGELWRKDRQVLTPLFNIDHLKHYFPIMIRYAKDLVEEFKRIDHHHVEVKHNFGFFGMKILVQCVFGDSFDEDYQNKISEVTKETLDKFSTSVIGSKIFGANFFGKIYPPIKKLNNLREVVKIRMKEMKNNNTANGDDLLSRMISSKYDNGESIDDEQIINEAMTMMLAGHETTSTNLIYLCYLLVKYPHVQEKLRNEIISVLGDRDPTPEDMQKLKYMKNVIKESLRLYMPAPVLFRYTTEDTIMESTGQLMPKGTALALNIMKVHHDPEIYPDPLEFIPERFDNEDDVGNAYNYLAFSGGARICIGKRFAMQEVEITLSMLLRKFRLTQFHPNDLKHVYSGTLHPKEFFLDYELL